MAKIEINAENEKYFKAYYDNEYDANRQMSFANAFAAGMLLVVWILYIVGLFKITQRVFFLVNIVFPIGILVLLTPLIYALFFKNFLRRPHYKHFVVFSFVLVVAILNIIIPKHALIGWALCIVIVNHYYNPVLGRITFGVVMAGLLGCMYIAMLVGEYDPHLLGNGVIKDGKIVYVDGLQERLEMLKEMKANGEDRWLKVFLYYFISRGLVLSLVFLVCNSLNVRTYKLLIEEIRVSGDQQKTKTELEVAKEIQLASLPAEFITNQEVEIQAELKAAKEVGGDFYDYFILGDNHVAIVIGDVSGKGIPAAMFMMKTITCFKNYTAPNRMPSEILQLVNKTIYNGNDSKMFVTCFLAIINTKTGRVKFANAGHNPPLVGQKGNYNFLKVNPGFLLGCFPEAYVKDEEFYLNNGDTITLYTDGITEAMNNNREQYGNERLLNVFNRKTYSCLVELHHELKDDVDDFVNGAEQSDDITYITLKYHGDEYNYKEHNFDASSENIPQILDFLRQFAENNKFDEKFTNNLLVVGDELCSNIVKFGYEDGKGEIFIRCLYNINAKEFIFTIIDKGIPFDPFENEAKPLEGDISKRPVGGLGLLIVKKLMSEYAYDRVNNKNITTVKKKFE